MGLVPELHRPAMTVLGAVGWAAARALNGHAGRAIDAFRRDPDKAGSQAFMAKLVGLEAEGRADGDTMMDAVVANINAGSDTTAITLSAALYYLYSNPATLAKLRAEVDAAASDPVTFAEAQKMAYLQVVIKEALRRHPAIIPMLPRQVPEGGAELGGYFFPAKVSSGPRSAPTRD